MSSTDKTLCRYRLNIIDDEYRVVLYTENESKTVSIVGIPHEAPGVKNANNLEEYVLETYGTSTFKPIIIKGVVIKLIVWNATKNKNKLIQLDPNIAYFTPFNVIKGLNGRVLLWGLHSTESVFLYDSDIKEYKLNNRETFEIFFGALSKTNIAITKSDSDVKLSHIKLLAEKNGVAIPSLKHVNFIDLTECITRYMPGLSNKPILNYCRFFYEQPIDVKIGDLLDADDYTNIIQINDKNSHLDIYKKIFEILGSISQLFIKIMVTLYNSYGIPIDKVYSEDNSDIISTYLCCTKYRKKILDNTWKLATGCVIKSTFYVYDINEYVCAINSPTHYIFSLEKTKNIDNSGFMFLTAEHLRSFTDIKADGEVFGIHDGLIFRNTHVAGINHIYKLSSIFIYTDKSWAGMCEITRKIQYNGEKARKMLSCALFETAFTSMVRGESISMSLVQNEIYCVIKLRIDISNFLIYKDLLTDVEYEHFRNGLKHPIYKEVYYDSAGNLTTDRNSISYSYYRDVMLKSEYNFT